MRENKCVMKLLLAGGGVFLVLVLWSGTSRPVSINWGTAGNPLFDESGVGSTVLQEGDIVQLICDKARDGIDPPGCDGQPMGDDRLVHVSYIGHGSFFEGEFSDDITTGFVGVGDILYVRAWNASTLDSAGRWGDTRQHDPETWVIDNGMFFTLNATENGSWATTSCKLRSEKRVYKAMLFGIEEDPDRSVEWDGRGVSLLSPKPNPFRGSVKLGFRVVGSRSAVLLGLDIYDVKGSLIRTFPPPGVIKGENLFVWDGTDRDGVSVGSGVFVARLEFVDDEGRSALLTKLVRTE